MTQAITSLKSTLGTLKEQTNALAEAITEIRDRSMRLEAERATILDRPLSKDDLLEIFLARIDKKANEEDAHWIGYFTHQAEGRYMGRSRLNSVKTLRAVRSGDVAPVAGIFLNRDQALPPGCRPITAEGLFSLFREPLKDAVRRHLDLIEWPNPDAQPADTYFQRLDEIEAELRELQAQEATIMSEAEKIGLTLPEPYQL